MPTIVTLRAAEMRSVQPFPLPRPSAIVTGTCTDPAVVAVAGAAAAVSFPGTNVSFTMIVPAHAGAASTRAAKNEMSRRRITSRILRRAQ